MKNVFFITIMALFITACNTTKKASSKSNLVEFTDKSLKAELKNQDELIVLEFSAKWCGPCKILEPILEELATEYKGRATIGKVDVDENTYTKLFYEIKSLPMIYIFKNGEIVDQQQGLTSKEKLAQKIEAQL